MQVKEYKQTVYPATAAGIIAANNYITNAKRWGIYDHHTEGTKYITIFVKIVYNIDDPTT